MKHPIYLNLLVILTLLSPNLFAQMEQAPKATKKPHKLEKHGHTRIDNYFWLRERENPEVIAYLEAENAYTNAQLKDTEALQEELAQEMIARVKQNDQSVPYRYQGYLYYNRYEEGKEYPIYCRKKLDDAQATEEIMFEVNQMAEGHSYYSLGGINISPNNRYAAFFVDTVGRRKYTLHFKDLQSGEILSQHILDASGFAWAKDNKTFFFGKKDEVTLRAYQVYRSQLGDTATPKLIYEEKDETFNTYVFSSKSGDYIFIASQSTLSSEYRFLPADKAQESFQILQPRRPDYEYSIEQFEDYFYILTNWNAKNFRLMRTPIAKPGRQHWEEVIAHRPDVLLENIETFKKYLVVEERKNGLTQLYVKPWQAQEGHYLNFGEATYTAGIGNNPEFDTSTLRYSYSSLTTPNSVYDYDMESREKTLRKQQEVQGGYNPEEYQAERLYATARDGVKVPISLVYKKGLKKNGKNPLLLYAYGSYGYSIDAYFSSVRLSLLDRGFVFAIAHIRGGQEMGRDWYENGKMFKKKNTFYDFIDCADYLISEKFTSPEYLFAEGGSAGGLLMGAVVNMRPELFKGVVAAVPFVDVVSTMLDDSIPLTTGEYDEWGNPNKPEDYQYILSYSPYDNVEAKAYPNMLVTTGLHDSQVQYWEPAKWVAKLRELKTDNNLLLLKTDMEAGHSGKTGRFKPFYDIAFKYAFMFKLIGIKE